jgi:two-component sensor histidine kinase
MRRGNNMAQKSQKHWNQRGTQVALLTLLVIAAIWSLAWQQYQGVREAAFDQEKRRNAALVRTYEERVLRSIEVVDQALKMVRYDHTTHRRTTGLDALLDALQLSPGAVVSVALLDQNGMVIAASVVSPAISFADRDYFTFHRDNPQDTLRIGEPILGRITDRWVAPFSRRLSHADGSFAGVVVVAVDPETLAGTEEQRLVGANASVALIGLDGITRVRNNKGKVSYGENVKTSALFKSIPTADIGQYEGVAASDGVRRTVNYRVVQGYPLVAVIASSLDDVQASVRPQQQLYLALAVLCTALVVGLVGALKGAINRTQRDLETAQASEAKLKAIIDLSPVPLAIANPTHGVVAVNLAFSATLGYTLQDVPDLATWWQKAYPDPAYRKIREADWASGLVDAHKPREILVCAKNGITKHMLVLISEEHPALHGDRLVSYTDISELRAVQNALTATVKDKTALLREVHHRVKNNLQVITSLLRLEAGRTGNAEAVGVLHAMQGRIRSMALLHELLYRSGTNAAIELGPYLEQLAQEAIRATAARGARVQLQTGFDSIWVTMDQATSCGLLVNELVANAIKHGFAGGRSGSVVLTLRFAPQAGQVVLQVSDDGAGLPADWDVRSQQSLGLQLVGDLAQQLHGTLDIGPAPLGRFAITFAVDSVSGFTPLTA